MTAPASLRCEQHAELCRAADRLRTFAPTESPLSPFVVPSVLGPCGRVKKDKQAATCSLAYAVDGMASWRPGCR